MATRTGNLPNGNRSYSTKGYAVTELGNLSADLTISPDKDEEVYVLTADASLTASIEAGLNHYSNDKVKFIVTDGGAGSTITIGTGFSSAGDITLTAGQVGIIEFSYSGASFVESYRSVVTP